MSVGRIDFDGVGSAASLAARIHELISDMPSVVPLEKLCAQFDIERIEEIDTNGFETALIMDENKARGSILLAKGQSAQRRRFRSVTSLVIF